MRSIILLYNNCIQERRHILRIIVTWLRCTRCRRICWFGVKEGKGGEKVRPTGVQRLNTITAVGCGGNIRAVHGSTSGRLFAYRLRSWYHTRTGIPWCPVNCIRWSGTVCRVGCTGSMVCLGCFRFRAGWRPALCPRLRRSVRRWSRNGRGTGTRDLWAKELQRKPSVIIGIVCHIKFVINYYFWRNYHYYWRAQDLRESNCVSAGVRVRRLYGNRTRRRYRYLRTSCIFYSHSVICARARVCVCVCPYIDNNHGINVLYIYIYIIYTMAEGEERLLRPSVMFRNGGNFGTDCVRYCTCRPYNPLGCLWPTH